MASQIRHLSVPSTIMLLAICTLPVAFLAPKGLAALAAVGGLLTLGQFFGRVPYSRLFALGSTYLILGIVVLAGASPLWSIDPQASSEAFKGVGTVATLGAVLVAAAQLCVLPAQTQPPGRNPLCFVLLALALALIAYLIADYSTGGGMHRLVQAMLPKFGRWHPNLAIRVIVALVLLFWCLLLLLDNAEAAGRPVWPWRIALLLGMAVLIPMAPQISARIALLLGLIAYAIGRWGPPRLTCWMMLMAGLMLVLGLPFIIHQWLDPDGFGAMLNLQRYYSGQHRLFIWEFVSQRILERPWLGWGLDSGRQIPGGDRVLPGGGEVLPMHPHNGFLQYWLELGLAGGMLLAAALAYAGHKLGRAAMPPAARAAGCGYVAAVFTFAFLSFNSWHNWWIGLIALTMAPLILAIRIAAAPRC